MSSSVHMLRPATHGRKSYSWGEHFNPADSREDFDCSPNIGSADTVSVHVRGGINGGPWREDIDDALIDVQLVPGTSLIVLLYDGKPAVIAHASDVGNRGCIEMAERFRNALERRKGPSAAPAREKRRVA